MTKEETITQFKELIRSGTSAKDALAWYNTLSEEEAGYVDEYCTYAVTILVTAFEPVREAFVTALQSIYDFIQSVDWEVLLEEHEDMSAFMDEMG